MTMKNMMMILLKICISLISFHRSTLDNLLSKGKGTSSVVNNLNLNIIIKVLTNYEP